MKKILLLILALSVLVIFPTWAVADQSIKIGANEFVIKINKKTGEISGVSDAKGDWKDKEMRRSVTVEGGILLIWQECSPGHWCVINGRRVWCP
jgi:hypothetical protein